MVCSIKPLCYLASCRIDAYFYWPKAVAFLMHYRISLHICMWRTLRTRGKSTPISSNHILRGETVKLRIVSWFKKLSVCTHRVIHGTANRCISFPSKTNGQRDRSSYASAFVAAHLARRWEQVTMPCDNILRIFLKHVVHHEWGEKTVYFICRLYAQENFLKLSLIKYWHKLNRQALEYA